MTEVVLTSEASAWRASALVTEYARHHRLLPREHDRDLVIVVTMTACDESMAGALVGDRALEDRKTERRDQRLLLPSLEGVTGRV